jgi:hypothetical protein
MAIHLAIVPNWHPAIALPGFHPALETASVHVAKPG